MKIKETLQINIVITILLMAFYLTTACNGNKRRSNIEIANNDSTQIIMANTINVYVENSASMDGFVNGMTEFEQVLYNYLSDIKISKVVDSLNLYYINSKVLPYKPNDKAITEDLEVLEDFIEKLDPSTFANRGGDRGKSDIADVLQDVLENTKENGISILVTDGVFSPGSNNDADEYLVNQQIGIKNYFSKFLTIHKDAAVIVYQLTSQFDGYFFDKLNKPTYYRGNLPFYIYVIGQTKYISSLLTAVPENRFKYSGAKNIFVITTGNKKVNYALNPSIGKYKKSKTDTNTTIEDLEKDRRSGKVNFAVDVDFSSLLLDEAYLLNTDNYQNDSQYDLEIKPCLTNGLGYTHTLNFTSDKVHKGTIIVKLKIARPTWIDEVNDNIGTSAITGKTYGIKYQLDGIFDAFTFYNKFYTEIKININ